MELNVKLTTYIAKASNYGGKRNTAAIKYIVIHYTANNGDTAIGNGRYFAANNTGTSAHYFVDETEIVQSVYDNRVAFHCGARKYYHPECRNSNSLGIEICSEKSNGIYYFNKQTVDNAVELVKWLMDKYNVKIENVIRHYDVTHKNCPAPYVESSIKWQEFKNMLVGEADEVVETGSINVNGKNIKIDKIIKDGTSFIKLRGLEAAGFNVEYNEDTKALALNNKIDSIDVNVNGDIKKINSLNINGSNYIPVRMLEEIVEGLSVDYKNNEVVINKNVGE